MPVSKEQRAAEEEAYRARIIAEHEEQEANGQAPWQLAIAGYEPEPEIEDEAPCLVCGAPNWRGMCVEPGCVLEVR